jgi:hypothetical protein
MDDDDDKLLVANKKSPATEDLLQLLNLPCLSYDMRVASGADSEAK